MEFLFLIFSCFLIGSEPPAEDKVIEPPEQAPFTIQARIDRAVEGDTVLVPPGAYFENIDFLGKAIVLKSQAGPESTIIDGGRLGSVVSFEDCIDTTSVLDGFTITHGKGTYNKAYQEIQGGGINAFNSSCKIIDCIIEENKAGLTPYKRGLGGGLYSNGYYSGSVPFVMSNCIIRINRASTAGGGVFVCAVSGYIVNCTFKKNETTGRYSYGSYCGGSGAGIFLSSADSFIVEKSLFSNNPRSHNIPLFPLSFFPH